jgi:putative transposase
MQGSWDHRADLLSVRREYGGLGVDQAKRLKTLEAENARLKRVVADQALDIAILKESTQGTF